jgi:hypothetical protein
MGWVCVGGEADLSDCLFGIAVFVQASGEI